MEMKHLDSWTTKALLAYEWNSRRRTGPLRIEEYPSLAERGASGEGSHDTIEGVRQHINACEGCGSRYAAFQKGLHPFYLAYVTVFEKERHDRTLRLSTH